MNEEKSIVVFQNKKIRRTWFNDEWWFVAVDIIQALTDSKDPTNYLKDMRRRDEGFKQGWGQIATPLLIDTAGGKQKINCVSTKGAFRLIQSIPSKKAEPFKLWLAQVKSSFTIENNDSTNTAKNIFITLKNPITNEQGLDDELEIEELTAELIAGILSTKLFYKGEYISWENCYSIEQLSPGDASTLDLSFSLKEGAVLNKGAYQCTLYIYQEKAPNKAEYIDEIPFTIII